MSGCPSVRMHVRETCAFFHSVLCNKNQNRSQLTRTPIGPFISNGNLNYDSVEKANVLLEQYSSVYSSTGYDAEIVNEISVIPGSKCLDTVDVSLDDINDAIDDFSACSSPGSDRKPALLLKQCKKSLQTPIRMPWKNSMLSGVIPQNLKFDCLILYVYT